MTRRVLPAYADPDRRLAAAELGAVHFIGIGGAGMSGIARIMLQEGIVVSGSDAKDSAAVRGLQAAGARVQVGHSADALGDAQTVVVSSAIKPTNPELAAALARGLLVIPRAEALAAVMAGKKPVAVAGAHGKTSTTSMLVAAIDACGADPSYAIGGDLHATGRNAHLGTGEAFAVEADESDGSFLLFRPHIAIVTNVEPDHLDNYGDFQTVLAAFHDFVRTITPGGALVACADDEHAASLLTTAREHGVRAISYGERPDADLRLSELAVSATGTAYAANGLGLDGLRVRVAAPGHHMALNSASVLAACIALGLDPQCAADGLRDYTGVARRMDLVGEAAGVRVYDDYAHHPTEVRAQLLAAREVAGDGRLIVCFQPHLFSRTQVFADQFAAALSLADHVLLMDVYPARESAADFPGVTGDSIARQVAAPVRFLPVWDDAAPALAELARPGDLVVTVGAGDVTEVGPRVVELLRSQDG
ncbi:UDP-N-acetylmuramate--L-alanine ligase [Blastococcus sp. Marseille-P5729]|uniref:UDP-N-acetylmuramate--L-alanine ligase n=1 Tax=Blastococcus sp. Marseille-P5729 TaxID=2086582 RepID=UPI000D0E8131|nr:UDP-N-acetylmuramate--L-alanine ligase [Blastococcus sp. Marseille-P5729]